MERLSNGKKALVLSLPHTFSSHTHTHTLSLYLSISLILKVFISGIHKCGSKSERSVVNEKKRDGENKFVDLIHEKNISEKDGKT
jgi:hypothetical protein